jgi:Zn-finger nucleic acid-binding protein
MKCPECRQDLLIVEWHDVELDLCVDGHGVWFDGQELEALFAKAIDAGRNDKTHEAHEIRRAAREFEASLLKLPAAPSEPRRRCPRCDAKMRVVAAAPATAEHPPVALDVCPHGHGTWFDDGELQQTLAAPQLAAIDGLDDVRAFLTDFLRADAPAAPPTASESEQP